MNEQTYTIRKLMNGAILIPAVLFAILVTAVFDLGAIVAVVMAIGITALLVLAIRKWTFLDRPISKNAYTAWNIVIIALFVVAYYSLRSTM
jgi:hypothetical protein